MFYKNIVIVFDVNCKYIVFFLILYFVVKFVLLENYKKYINILLEIFELFWICLDFGEWLCFWLIFIKCFEDVVVFLFVLVLC